MRLSREQFERYRRQLSVPGMSEDAQRRLLGAKAAIIGANAWASFAAQNLAQVGLGSIVVVDQSAEVLAQLKVSMEKLLRANPDVSLSLKTWRFSASEAEALFSEVDVVIDGLDDWQHKLSASDICMHLKRPFVHAGGGGFRYQVYTMVPAKSACLRCALPEVGIDDVPLEPVENATLMPVAAMVGSLQAVEAIKIVARVGATQGNELWKFDLLSGELETIHGLNPRADCPDCGRYIR